VHLGEQLHHDSACQVRVLWSHLVHVDQRSSSSLLLSHVVHSIRPIGFGPLGAALYTNLILTQATPIFMKVETHL
jgi:hypothetical protein